jgi:tryptophanyl-tRNA synthetase
VSRKTRLYSAMQPSGEMHIGRFEGALSNWIDLQEQHESFFGVVDLHAMTAPYESEQLQERSVKIAAWYLAAGIDPERSVIYLQSAVPEHAELAWVLGTLAPMGLLERMTQYKDKSKQNPEHINLGLFAYPVLQAADILLYKADVVPVGDDQSQHLELTRGLARKFNARFGETFAEPKTALTKARRIMGLDGQGKMSASKGNSLNLADDADTAWEKLRVAKTDERRKRRSDPGDPDDCNIYALHRVYSSARERQGVADGCRAASIGCFDCKKILATNIEARIGPVRERYLDWISRPDDLHDVLDDGARRARSVAAATMSEVRAKTGLTAGPVSLV